jgi:hypothetical protein
MDHSQVVGNRGLLLFKSLSAGVNVDVLALPNPLAPPGEHSRRRSRRVFLSACTVVADVL